MVQLTTGIYESIITDSLRQQLDKIDQGIHSEELSSVDDVPELLARHIYKTTLGVLKNADSENLNISQQIDLVNRIIDTLGRQDSKITLDSQLLLEVLASKQLDSQSPSHRPAMPLRRTGLLVNSARESHISHELVREIPSADSIDLICAFIRNSGIRLFDSELKNRLDQGAKLRVITSVYTGTTERKALDKLVKIGAEVKVSYDTTRTRLHAKAWLFQRKSGFDTAYIGSSNLTHSAQTEGLEWNVRISAIENPDVITRYKDTFDLYWADPTFEDYDSERDAKKLDEALGAGRELDRQPLSNKFSCINFSPLPHQSTALEAIDSERSQGYNKNLIVAATGIGKTWIAAFSYQRLRQQHGNPSLLFVAHRKEILEQSRLTFQLVMREADFGELFIGGHSPRGSMAGKFVFASIQSLATRYQDIEPTHFDVVIVDEFHHAAASSYDRLLKHLKPRYLLGLTATPERADGVSILNWFDNRIAYEARLWEALDSELLCPFQYFGINDTVDLSSISFQRGKYVSSELDNVLTGNHIRALRIHQQIQELVTNPDTMKALGFCAGVNHARFMANEFAKFGYRAASLDGNTNETERKRIRDELLSGKLNAVFVVDIYNEGVDLPAVDTLLLLRPTESSTIFLQQLGRGLRKGNYILEKSKPSTYLLMRQTRRLAMTQDAPGKSFRKGLDYFEFMELFPTEDSAREWFETWMWPHGRRCPSCGSAHTIAMTCATASSPYYCQSCQKQFSVKTNSLMHNSPLPYRKWLWAVYLHMTSLKGVSSMKLHRDIKVTQKTAWFMLQRIREAFRPLDLLPPMRGPVEVDETHVGGKRRNKSNAERRAATGRGFVDMTTVVGAKDRETNAVRAEVIATPNRETLIPFVERVAARGAPVYTDEASAYTGLASDYDHARVNHSANEYVRDTIHTNGIESFWSMLKRAHKGVYHKFSRKHLQRYVTDFSGRHNVREHDTLNQMCILAMGMGGRRLPYKMLIADNGLWSGANGGVRV